MKKDKLKELKEAARKLPEIFFESYDTQLLKGSELIRKGVLEVQDQKVIAHQFYKEIIPTKVSANHYRIMKYAYSRGGDELVKDYIKEVFLQHNQNKN